jgi:MFS family permease
MKDKNKMLLMLGLMAFLANGDNYAAAPLIINISNDLNLPISTAAISVTAYMLSFGVFTLLFGPLSDRFGKVKIISIAAFGTVIGGRIAPKLRKILKNRFLVAAGLIGSISLFALSVSKTPWQFAVGFLGFGIAFIFLQSTLISTTQEKLPKMRGTEMSLASLNMFVGGVIGTSVNGLIMKNYGTAKIFQNTSYIILIAGFESRKKQVSYNEA